MLSYRHAYHAGNFADIHKHATLCRVLASLGRKEKPFTLIDAFAGAGEYDLAGDEAMKTGEAEGGFRRFMQATDRPEAFAAYESALAAWAIGHPQQYPGSPRLMQYFLRAQDQLLLLELHSTDRELLARRFHRDPRVHVHRRDAYEGLPALLPPEHRRGLVLLDPSYELKSEYHAVAELLESAWRRWPQAVYVIWYPLLAAGLHQQLLAEVSASGIRRVFREELMLFPGSDRMRGSGLLWVNLPWQLDEELAVIGNSLADCLADGNEGKWFGEWLVGE